MFKMISTSAAVLAVAALASQSTAGTCQGSKYKQTSAQAACDSAQESTAYRPVQADIVDTAVGAENFKTLVAAVQAAGLVEALKGEGPFTVFAPTDEAFAKLPKGTVEALLKDKEKLAKILTYHVVKGNVTSKDLAKLNSAGSLQGAFLRIDASKGVRVNNAMVVTADLRASNGMIHVIDTVLLPPADIVDTAVGAGSFETLVAAVKAAGLVEALKGKGPLTVFAPTDKAFAKLPEGTIPALLNDKEKLAAVLTYHVVPGYVTAADAMKLNSAKTLQGGKLKISSDGGSVNIDDAKVIEADILTANGVIHVIDSVLLPN
ncbi:MAG: fasciclin domain-containing protein [Thermoguttaceae bacterium]